MGSVSPLVRRTAHTDTLRAVTSCGEERSGMCCLEIRPLPPEGLGGPLLLYKMGNSVRTERLSKEDKEDQGVWAAGAPLG